MAVTMPRIEITFEQKAVSLLSRSERGVAVLIVRDDTSKTFTHKQYADLSAAQADKSLYTADNYAAICDLMGFAPYQAHVFRADSDGALADTLAEIGRTVKTGWLAIAGQSAEDGLALAAWVKTQVGTRKKSYKAAVFNVTTAPDDMHVVHFVNEKVTFADSRGEQGGVQYLPSLIGIFAVCNVVRGCTNYLCSNLRAVQEVADNDAALGAGMRSTSSAESCTNGSASSARRPRRGRRKPQKTRNARPGARPCGVLRAAGHSAGRGARDVPRGQGGAARRPGALLRGDAVDDGGRSRGRVHAAGRGGE